MRPQLTYQVSRSLRVRDYCIDADLKDLNETKTIRIRIYIDLINCSIIPRSFPSRINVSSHTGGCFS